MTPALIDTDILSMFFRDDNVVCQNFEKYIKTHGKINFSIMTYYEIYSGLAYRDSKRRLNLFLNFANHSNIIQVNKESVQISSEVYSDLRTEGKLIDDIDILIAGVALVNDFVLITHNVRHFEKIKGLGIKDWSYK